MSMGGNKAVFLDRDGTINVEKEYLYKISDFEYLEGAVEGLRALSDMGYLLLIVTNQSGIARGYYTEEDYRRLDEWLRKDLQDRGVRIAGSYYCPHLPDGCVLEYARECDCRKPKTGLFRRAAKEFDIDMRRSFAVGDRLRDLSACEEYGVRGLLLSDAASGGTYRVCRNWTEIVRAVREMEGQEDI